MQYWIVKSGTKEVISGPFETQDEANKEMARFPVGGDAKTVTQGNYLGNGLIEAVQSGMTFKIDWDGESIVHVEYVRNGKVGLIRLNRPKTANGQPIRPEDKIEMDIEEFEASAKPVKYNPVSKKFESSTKPGDKEHYLDWCAKLNQDSESDAVMRKYCNLFKLSITAERQLQNSLNESAYEKDMDENKPVVVKGVKGMKSTPFTKKFKNMAAYEKWADSEAAENFEVQQVMNESAVFDFSTTNDADILKVSAALEKAGIPFEVEEKGESFVVKVLDSRDQLVASELIGNTMKESSGFSEGEEVKVVGNVSGEGKVGIIRDIAPSGHFYVVKFNDGTSASYHESNLVSYEGEDSDDEDEDLDESESKKIGIEHHSDGTRVISTYWDGRSLAKFIHPEQYNEVEEGGWAYSDGNEPNNAVNSIEDFIGLSLHLIQQGGGELYINGKQAHAKNIDQTSGSPVSIGELQFESGSEVTDNEVQAAYAELHQANIDDAPNKYQLQDKARRLAMAYAQQQSKKSHGKNFDPITGNLIGESAQLSPFERAGLNSVYSEDGKKATVKIFSECDMEKFNKIVEAYLNTYIESIEYKVEESDDNCLYVIEVKLVQSPETKGDPETMMKELKTESVLVENEVTDQVLASIAAFLKSNPNLVASSSYNSTKTYNKNGVEFGYSYSSQTRPPLVTVSLLNDKLSLLGLLTEPPKFIMRANFNGLHSVSSLKSTILNKAKSSLIQQLKNEKEKSTEQIDQLLKLMQ